MTAALRRLALMLGLIATPALAQQTTLLVHADRPGTRVEVPAVGGWSYLRFHQGRPDSPGYRRSKLADYADALVDLRPREVFAYFNNDAGGAAPEAYAW